MPPYAYEWSTLPPTFDSTITTATQGLFWLTVTDALGCEAQRGALVEGPTTSGYDLEINLVAGTFRPSFVTLLTLDAFNSGCTPISGQIKLVLDSLVSYQTADPLPDAIIGDTLLWSFNQMSYDNGHFRAEIWVVTDTFAPPFSVVHFDAIVTPVVGDAQPLDNEHLGYAFDVVNSLDPNVKAVFPVGACEEHYVLRNQPLTYTIQFQNTGNADALEIVVLDTLDPALAISSLSIKGSSHPMVTEVMPPGNILRFVFHDIHLPDSTTDEPASHGYLIYEIAHIAGIPSGTQVRNGSAIYFDFNPPVLTNTVMNTFVDIVPACPVSAPGTTLPPTHYLQLHPNPAIGIVHLRSDNPLGVIEVVNPFGQLIWTSGHTKATELTFDVRAWAKGIYFLRQAPNGHSIRLVVE
jgi:uncharacterized repeat protein (TIGR01451 family)